MIYTGTTGADPEPAAAFPGLQLPVERADRTMGILIGVSEVVAVAPSGSAATFGRDPQFRAQVLSRDGPEGALGSPWVPC